MTLGELKEYCSRRGLPDSMELEVVLSSKDKKHGSCVVSVDYDFKTSLLYLQGVLCDLTSFIHEHKVKELHPTTYEVLKYFNYQHLPPHLQDISKACHDLMVQMVNSLPCNPQLTRGLHKLLEAKDCFVRANVKPGDHCGTHVEGGETFKSLPSVDESEQDPSKRYT